MNKAADQKYVIGIIGGVGPSATIDLYKLILKNTPARSDQEHLRIIIDSNTQIPDRTQALLYDGSLSSPYLLESAKLLMDAGVDFLICPCNTAHCFLPGCPDSISTNRLDEIKQGIDEFNKEINIPLVSMIEETAKYIKEQGIKKVGLLSTAGTAKAGIYQAVLNKYDIHVVVPTEKGIQDETEAIYGEKGIKANVKYERTQKNKDLLLSAIEDIEKQEDIEGIIMGCTEIPLCLEESDTDHLLINPTEVLAKSAVDIALGKKPLE